MRDDLWAANMVRDELWAELLALAMDRSGCNAPGITCRVNFVHTPWYVVYQHLDDQGHECEVCNPAVLPTRIVSIQTLQTTRHEVLVGRLARWLDHQHVHHQDSSGLGVPGLVTSAVVAAA